MTAIEELIFRLSTTARALLPSLVRFTFLTSKEIVMRMEAHAAIVMASCALLLIKADTDTALRYQLTKETGVEDQDILDLMNFYKAINAPTRTTMEA